MEYRGKVTIEISPEEYYKKKNNHINHGHGQFPDTPKGTMPEADESRDTGCFMQNVPSWLRDMPDARDFEYEVDTKVLVIGAGAAGAPAVLRLAQAGVDVLCVEAQSWKNYDVYPMDMAVYNSKYFLDKGVPEYDPVDIMNEYQRKAVGHIHPQLIRDYAFRSGEMFDWMLKFIPEEYTSKYAHPMNYRGNPGFAGEICGSRDFIGTVQWRTEDAFSAWGYGSRYLLMAAQELGAGLMFSSRGLCILQDDNGAVTGAVCLDPDKKKFRVNCKAVLVCAGDFGGNREMLLDLSDQMRNLAWSYGMDRTDPKSVMPAGRDGSGIKMCMWAGGVMEAGPRAAMNTMVNKKPGFAFGGCFPTFGPDGKRFMNESLTRHGSSAVCDMLPLGGVITCVTDMNWDEYLDRQGYGHDMFDRSNDEYRRIIKEDMNNLKTGPEGFEVTNFMQGGMGKSLCMAADTLEELAQYLGYRGEAADSFVREVERYNEMCDKGRDGDWGCDPNFLFPIRRPPFIGTAWKLGRGPVRGGLVQHAGVCTDGRYNVVRADRTPIAGLYAAGNCCGQRYAIQYHTPTAGNSAGSAMTSGYVAAEHVMEYLTGR